MPSPLNPLIPSDVEEPSGQERMWPLDLALVALSGLLLTMIVGYLPPNDPTWWRNRWTYIVGIPVITVIASLILRRITTLYVRKSLQLGFLFSAFVHLLLVVVAVRWVIFPHYFPEAFAGVKPERSPIRKTLPESLFQKPTDTETTTPDWSKPVDAQTTSRVVPQEERILPPVKRSASRLELPRPSEPRPTEPIKALMPRPELEASKPQPSDAPSRLARRFSAREASPAQQSAPEVPIVETTPVPTAEAAFAERNPTQSPAKRARAKTSASVAMSASAPDVPVSSEQPSPLPAMRMLAESMPAAGQSGLTRQRSQRERPDRPAPAGSAPAPPTVAIARVDESSSRMVAPAATPLERQSDAVGAQIAMVPSDAPFSSMTDTTQPGSGQLPQRATFETMAGLPSLAGTDAAARPRATRRRSVGGTGQAESGDAAVARDIGQMLEGVASESLGSTVVEDTPPQRAAAIERSRREQAEPSIAKPQLDTGGYPPFELPAPEGPVGLAGELSERTGIMPSDEPAELASMDITRETRVRRNVGGPVTPAGMSVAAVESFSRRVQRTNGGAAPAPAGMVGPATEEAIELGLAFLASRQNDDGSWSLQGNGEDVLLQSDTAATGLCLLAFQGAGYTHRQHQYAATVAKALEFLVNNQRTNGDLYRTENPISDQNVAFYSHGIASLAVCEAYGMTQDYRLREPAQLCLNYIAATQNRDLGGWRYTPQVSADTSVTGWMMMALKSGELAGLEVPERTYVGINRWLERAKGGPNRRDLYVYDPDAPDTPQKRHGRKPTPTMTAVGMLMRMYSGWRRDRDEMQSAADYLLEYPPNLGTELSSNRDTYYWYYATQVMFHMGGDHWDRWNQKLNPLLIDSQLKSGPEAGSWDPVEPVQDRWSAHGGRMYVTTMNLLNLEVYYRHLPIYEETGAE